MTDPSPLSFPNSRSGTPSAKLPFRVPPHRRGSETEFREGAFPNGSSGARETSVPEREFGNERREKAE
jgi:hypothetical protein